MLLGCLGALPILLSGCVTRVARSDLRPGPAPGFERWSLVLDTPTIARARLFEPMALAPIEYARRDAALSLRNPRPILAIDQWPVVARPDLDLDRHLVLPTTAGRILYFRATLRRY